MLIINWSLRIFRASSCASSGLCKFSGRFPCVDARSGISIWPPAGTTAGTPQVGGANTVLTPVIAIVEVIASQKQLPMDMQLRCSPASQFDYMKQWSMAGEPHDEHDKESFR